MLLEGCTIQEATEEYKVVLDEKIKNLKGKVTPKKVATSRTQTIFQTFENLISRYPYAQPGHVWRIVAKAHVASYLEAQNIAGKAGSLGIDEEIITELLFNDSIISTFESAQQSWKRSSGIAWENFFQDSFKPGKDEVNVVSSSSMGKLLKGGHINRITGEPTPLHVFDNQEKKYFLNLLASKDFDLFILYYNSHLDSWRLFGLIQCKTSIRDRVKINSQTSVNAMNNRLWSILLALDPDEFLKGQYYEMAKTDWHGVYLLDNIDRVDGNIYRGQLDNIQNLINDHANQVISTLTVRPEVLNEIWRPN